MRLSKGGRCTFRWPGDEWGYHNFVAVSDILDTPSVYMESDFFSVRLEMRIKTAENESSALTMDRETLTYIVILACHAHIRI